MEIVNLKAVNLTILPQIDLEQTSALSAAQSIMSTDDAGCATLIITCTCNVTE